jgi:hypothetical protein
MGEVGRYIIVQGLKGMKSPSIKAAEGFLSELSAQEVEDREDHEDE